MYRNCRSLSYIYKIKCKDLKNKFSTYIPLGPFLLGQTRMSCVKLALRAQSYFPSRKIGSKWHLANSSLEFIYSWMFFQDCCFSNRYTSKQSLTTQAITTERHIFNIFLYILWTKQGGDLWLSLESSGGFNCWMEFPTFQLLLVSHSQRSFNFS